MMRSLITPPHTSWTHRLSRLLVRPLVGTPVTPNHLTTLRLATGLAACASFAVGDDTWTLWGGVLWLVSCLLDRADGELARMDGLSSPWGHRYDYYCDVAVVPTFGARWLIPRLLDLGRIRPDLTVHLNVRLEPFDSATQPFDAAIHCGTPDWPGAVCEYLMGEESVPVSSPTYRDQLGIKGPEDLDRAVLLHQTTRPFEWLNWFEMVDIRVRNPLKGPRYEMFSMTAQGAVSGLGVALVVPRFLVTEEIEDGRLNILFDHPIVSPSNYYLGPVYKAA